MAELCERWAAEGKKNIYDRLMNQLGIQVICGNFGNSAYFRIVHNDSVTFGMTGLYQRKTG